MSTHFHEDAIGTPENFDKLVDFCKELGIEQLTWRPVSQTSDSEDLDINEWVDTYGISFEAEKKVVDYVGSHSQAEALYGLAHGAMVYDYKGQNVCMSSCLTRDANEEMIRQLIFFPNGELYTDWEFKGSRLL